MDQFRSSTASAGSQSQLQERLMRLKRAVAFCGQIADALRKEFDVLWRVPVEEVRGLPPQHAPKIADFVERVDALLLKVAEGKQLIEVLPSLSQSDAGLTLMRFDAANMTETAKGLQGRADAVRASGVLPLYGRVAYAAPQPARSGAAETGKLGTGEGATSAISGWLRKLIDPPTVKNAPAPAAQPHAKAPTGSGSAAADALKAACELVSKVVAYVDPELRIVDVALKGVALPGKGRPWPEVRPALDENAEEARLSPDERTWLLPLAKKLVADVNIVRKAHMAVTQWLDAKSRLAAGQSLLAKLPEIPVARHPVLVANVEVGKLRASVLPLTHLHLQFAGVPVFADLFPPPE